MSRKRGLGKGLDALIPAGEEFPAPGGGILQVSTDDIQPNPRQPRTDIDAEGLKELADSIREHGILQPLIVAKPQVGTGYLLIAGERRLEAARLAGLSRVPVIVRQADERQGLEWALIENLQRTDLNPLEAAAGYQQLAQDFGLSHEEIAARIGKNRTTVTNTLRLLKLSSAVRQALAEGVIREGHARALLALPTHQAQSAALQTVVKRELNVRQTEELVRRLSGERRPSRPPPTRSPEEIDLEEQLSGSLGTRVTVKRGRRGGSLVIRFYSDEELNAIVDRLLSDTSGS
ncbi:MAG TPA: ParB/RepB/Spo0J family partition protein [Anaerolineae bacterium]|nr:ParB/RepB/Spo0J family partition protein [Anaerolineae bacterium]